MKKINYFIIWAIGLGTGWLLANRVLKEKYEAIVLEEVKSVREAFGHALDKATSEAEVQENTIITNTYQSLARDYTKPSLDEVKAVMESHSDKDLDAHMADREYPEEDRDIFCVTQDEFVNEADAHDKITLNYYDEDNILCDSLNEIIPNPEQIIGEDALDSFGCLSENDDIVYIRNTKRMSDFEIIRHHSSWEKDVMGVIPTKPKKKKNTVRRDTDGES